MVQDSLGFGPNELVFGHKVRGPLAVLHNGLKEGPDPPQSLLQYVDGFRQWLFIAGQMAKENLLSKQMKQLFDRKTEYLVFYPGVLPCFLFLLLHSVPSFLVHIQLFIKFQIRII